MFCTLTNTRKHSKNETIINSEVILIPPTIIERSRELMINRRANQVPTPANEISYLVDKVELIGHY